MRTSLLALFSFLSLATLPGEFRPPSEDAILFRRDAIPLDEARQQELASLLISVIHRPSWDRSAEQQRVSAQLLSLARQLAPQSPGWRKTQSALIAGTLATIDDAGQRLRTLGELERFVLYLLEQERGSQAHLLAKLILDPLAVAAPGLPVTTLRDFFDEKKRWRGSLAS